MQPTWYYYGGLQSVPLPVQIGLEDAYMQVFSASPWNERWEREAVESKLRRELESPLSFLSVMDGEVKEPVAGACWGAVVSNDEIVDRVLAAHPFSGGDPSIDLLHLRNTLPSQVVYVDEIFIRDKYRKGLDPIANLVFPVGECSVAQGKDIICWSGKDSRIVPILLNVWEFGEVLQIGDIVFYHLPSPLAQVKSQMMIDYVSARRRAA